MNFLSWYLISFSWALRQSLRQVQPPPHPPNYINPNYSTGVPPPPKPPEEKYER